jgi:chromosome partitioning protein
MTAKVITFFSRKGGTAKTTNTFFLGLELASQGKKILLVDTDPQGTLSILCGIDTQRSDDNGLTEVLSGKKPVIDAVIQTTTPNLDILAIKEDDELLEKILLEYNSKGKQEDGTHLKMKFKELDAKLGSLKNHYDYILIDTNPAFGCLNFNALFASDYIISCLLADDLSLLALDKIQETIDMVSTLKDIKHIGCIVSMFESRNKVDLWAVENIKERNLAILGIIPKTVNIKARIAEGLMTTNPKAVKVIKSIAHSIINEPFQLF